MSEVQIQTMGDGGQGELFTALFSANRDRWVRLSQSVLRDRQEAEDLVQETMTGLWEKRDSLSLKDPAAYASRAVWLNSLKRKSRAKKMVALDETAELAAPEAEEPFPYGELDPLTLEQAVAELPEAQRAVIRLKYYVGLTFQEIGGALSISLNTAASRARYALKALRENLGGSTED